MIQKDAAPGFVRMPIDKRDRYALEILSGGEWKRARSFFSASDAYAAMAKIMHRSRAVCRVIEA